MSDTEATFVIVGGGIAAVSCVEQLSQLCPNESILVLSASRLVKIVSNWQKIGHAMESFDVQEASAESVFQAYPNVRIVSAYCTGLDHRRKEVYTSSGQIFKYKMLYLAAGGRPKMLSDNRYVIGIRDTDSVLDFQSRLKGCRRLVVVGNGGIATELVYEVQKVEVIWIVKHKSVSATFVDAGAAEFFMSDINSKKLDKAASLDDPVYVPKKRLKYTHAGPYEEQAVSKAAPGSALGPDWVEDLAIVGASDQRQLKIEYESEIERIFNSLEFHEWQKEAGPQHHVDAGEWPVYILLSSGKIYGCDLIVSATGVVPNSMTFADERNPFQMDPDGGILVDDQMRTSLENVYAAGDLCTAAWPLAKHWFQMRLWTQARQMGSYAGRCMALHWSKPNSHMDLDICFEIFTHVTKFFGYKVVLLGLFNAQKLGTNFEVLLRVKKGEEYVKIIVGDSRVQGALLIGETDLEETMENLIMNQTDISDIKDDLLNPTVDIEDYFD